MYDEDISVEALRQSAKALQAERTPEEKAYDLALDKSFNGAPSLICLVIGFVLAVLFLILGTPNTFKWSETFSSWANWQSACMLVGLAIFLLGFVWLAGSMMIGSAQYHLGLWIEKLQKKKALVAN